jgi:uncharacterized protein (DUF58 family)
MPSVPAASADPAREGAGSGAPRFDERFLRKLESLVMTIRRSARLSAGLLRANRASKRVGAGLEFADHRDYAAGDDLRYIDWNLYGRLDRLALRLFQEEEDLLIEVLVDASASMGVGSPSKLDFALQIGAALAYVGLANLDRVALSPLGDEDAPVLPPARGKGAILPILRFLGDVRASGRVGLGAAVRAFLGRRPRRRRGLAIVISDFYDPSGHRAALDLLRHHRLEVVAIQVSAPQELAPEVRGDVELRDIETGETRELTVSPAVVAAYRRRHQTLLRDLEGYCRERAIPCFTVVSDQAFDAVVLRMFRAGGLLR